MNLLRKLYRGAIKPHISDTLNKKLAETYNGIIKITTLYTTYQYDKSIEILFNPNILKNKMENLNNIINSPLKIFYHIARDDNQAGLFSYVRTHLAQVAYAISKGYVPIIDMQNYANPYLEKDKLGKENSWEYYFQQPFGYGLDILDKESKKSSIYTYPKIIWEVDFNNVDKINFWHTIYRNYFRLNENTETYVNDEYNKLIPQNKRVLGVLCRGTDYKIRKPYKHPIQPDIDLVIEKVRQSMEEWNLEYIYLATDERSTLESFKNSFPNKVLTNSRKYYDSFDYNKQLITQIKFDRKNDTYLQGLEYLSSIMILSRCTCLVAGICNGSVASFHINGGKYENTYFFDLGRYGA